MKKWLSALAVIIVLLVAGIYIFIPSNITTTHYIKSRATAGATQRFLTQKENWRAWWPGTTDHDSSFTYKNYTFIPTIPPIPNRININITNPSDSFPGYITILALSKDSVALAWESMIETSSNPFHRLQSYNESKRVRTAMTEILDSLRVFMEKNENVYGITVTQTRVTDTLLVTTRNISDNYPSTREIYQLIGQLEKHLSAQGAEATNPPMLYVQHTEDNRIQTMVAIPVNKVIPGTPNILFKRMVPGKILVTEIKGGPHTVRQAFTQMEYYVEDYKKISPAIPFEMLITNRMHEPDTAKWITRIYYPIL